MTVGQAIDLVHLAVTGGHLTQDSNVQRADICAYLPSAISYFTTLAIRERRAEMRQNELPGGPWSDGSFYADYTVTPVKDTTTSLYYADLSGSVMSLPSLRAIESVYYAKNPTSPFIQLASPQALAGAWGIMGDNVFFYTGQGTDGATRLWLLNYSAVGSCDVVVRALLTADCLSDDAPMPCPAEVEMMVIDKCVQHFGGQRGMPADNAKDDRDLNQDNQAQG